MSDVFELLDRCELHYRRGDAQTALLQIAPGPGSEAMSVQVQECGWFLRIRAMVAPCTAPDLATLRRLNDHNTYGPLGSMAAWSRDVGHLVLTLTLPRAPGRWPAPPVIMAALATLSQLKSALLEGRQVGSAEAERIFGSTLTFDGMLDLDGLAREVGKFAPLTRQADGSYATRRRYQDAAADIVVRFSHEAGAGLCVDALADGDPSFPGDERFLRALAELNALLVHGAVSLWAHPSGKGWLAVHRYCIPLPWLAVAEAPDRTLLCADTVAALLDNASLAWDDVIRIVQGGPVERP
ncbi:MAG: hypothetical protein R3B13_14940 [Polyangiaceae bacterium]